MLGRVRTDEDGRVDIKGSVLKGVVTTARILALRHGITTHATAARLSGLIERAHGGTADLAGFDEDHQLALDLVLEQQLLDIAEGKPPGNKVTARSLSARQTQALKAALAAGTTRVSYDGKSVEFRSLAEIKEIIALIEAELSGAVRTRSVRFRSSGDKGL
jgi:signal-transduction protein with cAMP-binding, CBS, and nucleotidyltransferase domain